MAGYVKGTSARGEIRAIREAHARARAAVLAWPDVPQSFRDATELEQLGAQISQEASGLRERLAAALVDERGVRQADLARMLHLSPGRVGQLVRAGRQQKGTAMSDPATLEELPPVAVAIITSARGVLIARRRDGIPPWTFPGGEMRPGEKTAAAVLLRRVPEETGITVTPTAIIGRRVHPRTGHYMIYVAATAAPGETPRVREDDEDLDAVEWKPLDDALKLMPDMYEPARQHLLAVLGGSIPRP